MSYLGTINCSGNPVFPSGTAGDRWQVSAAGRIGGANGTYVNKGDVLVCVVTGAAGTKVDAGARWTITTGSQTDVQGPESSTDGAPVLFDGTSGKVLKQGTALVAGTDYQTPIVVAAPASAAAAGAKGSVATDGTYLYLCTATNTWVRAALALATW